MLFPIICAGHMCCVQSKIVMVHKMHTQVHTLSVPVTLISCENLYRVDDVVEISVVQQDIDYYTLL